MHENEMITDDNTIWQVPQPRETLDVNVDSETVIHVRRHGNPDGPRLLFSHGNGLAIDLYFPFWSLLLDDFDLMVYDLRNHGSNRVSSLLNHTMPNFASDHEVVVEEIDRWFGAKPKIGVYHSVSALSMLLTPTKGESFDGWVLFDPPLCKPGQSYLEFDEVAERVAALARQRAARFKTLDELSSILPYLPNFQKVVDGVPDLFVRSTLRPADDGSGFELRCPRDYEAQIIEYASVYAVLINFPSYQCPIKVIGADPTLPFSYLPTLDLSDAVGVDYDFLPEATHFLQLEQPEECVETMLEFVDPLLRR